MRVARLSSQVYTPVRQIRAESPLDQLGDALRRFPGDTTHDGGIT